MNALEDRSVPDKQSWDASINFMENMLKEKLKESKDSFMNFNSKLIYASINPF
jgi:hypothetical protein